ncbi:hypothetical protein RVR_5831 [Actinacidiphila reveromycinica]|uniref:Phage tail tape measure protein domain-containing protein n=1 Tax=Actinacidiphila reveromycinica TaxID=659352 RepID=A0A7U3VPZ2_9ACTN|nr:phage tail tape measure protein [Streptomyces sp. SN-593]BBA99282.1 hypothetical protein RVR_5831 [Streptomyces sp. SN-593]
MALTSTGVRYDVIAKDSASKVFDKIGKQAGKTDGILGKAAKSAAKYGAVMGGAVAAGLVVAADKAVAFQTEMTKISTQAGGTTKDVGVLSKQVLQLGKYSEQGPQQLADSMYHLKSIGLDNVAAMKDLKVASDLAAVGGSNLEDTTNALGGAWRSGIKGAETFSKSAATVNAVIGAGNMRMEDFVSAIGTGILPSAKSFGLSLKSVGSALALMTDEGIPAVDAATRLRMSISLLGAPSGKAEDQLKKIGLTGTDLAKEMRSPAGLVGAIGLLKTKLDASGLSAVQQSQVISRAFGGGRSSSGILTLLNNYDVLVQKQAQITKSMAKFPSAVAQQRKTVQAQMDLIKSNLDVTAIEIGDKVLPAASKAVVYLNKTALPTIGKVSLSLERMIPVNRIEGDLKQATGFVSDFVTGLEGPKKAKVEVTPEVKKLSQLPASALEFGDVLPKKAAVPFPVSEGLIPSMPKPAVKKQAESQAQQLGDTLRKAMSDGLGDAVKGLDWKGLGGTLGKGLDSAFGYVASHSKTLGEKVSKAIQGIDWVEVGKDFGTTALPLAIGFIDNIFAPLFTVDFWKKHWLDTIIAVVSVVPVGKVFDAIGGLFAKLPWGKLGDVIGDGLSKIPWGKSLDWAKWIGRTGKTAGKAVGDLVSRIGTELKDSFSRTFPSVATWFGREIGLIPTRLGVMGLELKAALKNGFESVTDSVPGVSGKLIRAVLRYFTKFTFYNAGINLISGLYNGVVDKLAKAGGWVSAHIVDPFVSHVKSAFGIHSPSTVFAGIGGFLISGLYNGVVDKLAGIGKWVSANIKAPLVGAIVKPASWLHSAGGNIISGLVSGTWDWLAQKGHDFKSWASKIKDKIVDAVVDVFDINSPSKVMMEYGGHIVAGLAKGMLQGKDALKAVAKEAFHSPLEAAKALVSNGVSLPAKWAAKLLSAKTPGAGSGAPLAPGVASAQKYASGLVGQMWPKSASSEMSALIKLWNGESGWRANAENMSSGAYGIPQALPASKMAAAGSDWRTNAATQIRWGLSYIKGRYGDPMTAWASWNSHSPHWYAKGGLAQFGETAWVGEKGPELMQVTRKGTRIYNNTDSLALAKGAGIKIPGYATGTVTAAQAKVDSAQRAYEAAKEREDRARGKAALAAAKADLRAAQLRLSAAKKELAAATAAAKRSKAARTTVANAISNGFLKTLETGTASAIASAVKSMNTKLQNAGYGSLVAGNNRTATKLGALATQKASIASQISAAKSYASDQASSLGDYLGIGDTSATSVSSLIAQMQQSQSTGRSFASEIAKLSKMGLNKTLLAQVADQGPGGSLASMLAGASSYDIKQLNALATSQNKLTSSFGNTMADAMYDSGAQAGKGFLTGLQAQETAIQKEMNKLAEGMVSAIKKKLKIKSPSQVFRDQVGKQVALGMAAGIAAHGPKAVLAAQRMADMTAAVRAKGGTGTGAAAAVHETHVHVHFDDEALRGLIDVQVKQGVEAGHADLVAAARNTGGY